MNCVFLCIFNNETYIKMIYLLLESIYIYGNIGDDIEILIYTTTKFMDIIKQSHLYDRHKINFEINDTYTNVKSACSSRLDLFSFKSIDKYDKILYLDTDILIKGDLHSVFDIVKEDILYVLEEFDILKAPYDYYGRSLFKEEIKNYSDTSGFTSGILLFNNCEKIKTLFENINISIRTRPHPFFDQPHFVYNAFKYNMYNNKILKEYAVNRDTNIYSDKIIHHFPGTPGQTNKKMHQMTTFLNELKDDTINKHIEHAKLYINEHLMPIINECGEKLEGNIFMKHHTTQFTEAFINKTKNISNVVLNQNVKNVMEIGFNAGFSTLLLLLSNPNIHITCVDLGDHKYARPCFEKIKETFGDRMELKIGDSTKILPQFIDTYDLIHIDGGHSVQIAENDILNCYRLSKPKTILIMDDYDFKHLHPLWDKYVSLFKLKPLDIYTYNSPHHDIKFV